ncbi:hypothetical protein ACWCQY_18250, partial [Streptomyces sp. NPDC002078]
MGELDDRVSDAAGHGVTGAARHPERPADLAFLGTGGHPSGLLAARFHTGGRILAAAVVRRDAQPAPLTAAQRVALDASGIRVLAGLAAPSSASAPGRRAVVRCRGGVLGASARSVAQAGLTCPTAVPARPGSPCPAGCTERPSAPGGAGIRVGLPAVEPSSGVAVVSSARRPGPLRRPALPALRQCLLGPDHLALRAVPNAP